MRYPSGSWQDWSEYLVDAPVISKKIESDIEGEAGVIVFDNASVSFRYEAGSPVYTAFNQDLSSVERYMFRISAPKSDGTFVQLFEGVADFSTIEWDGGEPIISFEIVDKLSALALLESVSIRGGQKNILYDKNPDTDVDSISINTGAGGESHHKWFNMTYLSDTLIKATTNSNTPALGEVIQSPFDLKSLSLVKYKGKTPGATATDPMYIDVITSDSTYPESELQKHVDNLFYYLNNIYGIDITIKEYRASYDLKYMFGGTEYTVTLEGGYEVVAYDGLKLIETLVRSKWSGIPIINKTGIDSFPIPIEYFLQLVGSEPFGTTPLGALKKIANSMNFYLFIDSSGSLVITSKSSLSGGITRSIDGTKILELNKKYFWDKLVDGVTVNAKSWLTDPQTGEYLTGVGTITKQAAGFTNTNNIKPRNEITIECLVKDTTINSQEELNNYALTEALQRINFYGKRHSSYKLKLWLNDNILGDNAPWELIDEIIMNGEPYAFTEIEFDLTERTVSLEAIEKQGHDYDYRQVVYSLSETNVLGGYSPAYTYASGQTPGSPSYIFDQPLHLSGSIVSLQTNENDFLIELGRLTLKKQASILGENLAVTGGNNVLTGSNDVSIQLPQNIYQTSTPTFTNIILTSLQEGFLPYKTAGGFEDSDIFFDAVNNRIGIGTTTPSSTLQVIGQIRASSMRTADGAANAPSYGFESDPDTGIFRPAEDKIGFATNATLQAVINSMGYLGLGTEFPLDKLHIVGGNIIFSGAAGSITNISNYSLNFGTNNSLRLTISNDGQFHLYSTLVRPYISNTLDLGLSSHRFKNYYGYNIDINGAITQTGGLNTFAGSLRSIPFVSQMQGWQITSGGNADFRSIYADELYVKAFIADISQALAGSDFLTKSVAIISRDMTVPNSEVFGTTTLYIEDLPGFPEHQVFADNDWIRLRVIDRSGGGIVVANVWGKVTNYTNLANQEQSWTFTCHNDGGMNGKKVFTGSLVLDYGQSGDGFIERTVLDPAGSPYERIATWTGNPTNPANYSLKVQVGNLDGISDTDFGALSGFGLYAVNNVYIKGVIKALQGGEIAAFDIYNNRLGTTNAFLQGGSFPGIKIFKNEYEDFVGMYFTSTLNWGLTGKVGGVTMFSLGSSNYIGPWNFMSTQFYNGDVRLEASASLKGFALQKNIGGSNYDLIKIGDFTGSPPDVYQDLSSTILPEGDFDTAEDYNAWGKTDPAKFTHYAAGYSGYCLRSNAELSMPGDRIAYITKSIPSEYQGVTIEVEWREKTGNEFSGSYQTYNLSVGKSSSSYITGRQYLASNTSWLPRSFKFVVPVDATQIYFSLQFFKLGGGAASSVYIDEIKIKVYNNTFFWVNKDGPQWYASSLNYISFLKGKLDLNAYQILIQGVPPARYRGYFPAGTTTIDNLQYGDLYEIDNELYMYTHNGAAKLWTAPIN